METKDILNIVNKTKEVFENYDKIKKSFDLIVSAMNSWCVYGSMTDKDALFEIDGILKEYFKGGDE